MKQLLTEEPVGTKAARTGIKLAEVFDAAGFERKLRQLHSGYSKRYGNLLKYDVEEELKRFEGYRTSLAKYTVDAVTLMKEAQDKNTNILIEGANALMLDIDYGTVNRLVPFLSCVSLLTKPGITVPIRHLIEHRLGWHLYRSCHQPNQDSRDRWVINQLETPTSGTNLLITYHSVVKAYTTRVGGGPFVSEDTGE